MPLSETVITYLFRGLKKRFFIRPEIFYIFLTDIIFSVFISVSFNISGFIHIYIIFIFLATLAAWNLLNFRELVSGPPVNIILNTVIFFISLFFLINVIITGTGLIENAGGIGNYMYNIAASYSAAFSEISFFVLPSVFILNIAELLLIRFGKGMLAVILNIVIMYALTVVGYERSIGIISVLFVFISVFYSGIFISVHKNNYTLSKNIHYIKFISMLSFLITVTVLLVSVPFIEFNPGKRFTGFIWDKFISVYNSAPEFKITGFGRSENLGGKMIVDNSVVLKISGDFPGYLRGMAYDHYTGKGWKSLKLKSIKYEKKTDFSMDILSSENVEIIRRSEITRVNSDFSEYFTPPATIELLCDDKDIEKTDGDIYYSKDNGRKIKKYSVLYYENSDISNSRMPERADGHDETETEKYLQIPEGIDPGIIKLTKDICMGSETVNEKMNIISKFLHENYRYDVNVNKVPDRRGFVEHFLLYEKRGYCSYFASAAAVMGRISGVPTRYIEGFRLHKLQTDNESYLVTNSMAHAWIEYFDAERGGQWITFDPTPGGAYEEWFMGQLGISFGKVATIITSENGKIEIDEEKIKISDEKTERKLLDKDLVSVLKFAAKTVTLFPVFAAIFFIIAFCFTRFFNSVIIKEKIPVTAYYIYTVRLAELCGYKFSNFLTDSENCINIDNKQLQTKFKELVNAMHAEYYGNYSVIEFDRKSLFCFLLLQLREKKSFIFMYAALFSICIRNLYLLNKSYLAQKKDDK